MTTLEEYDEQTALIEALKQSYPKYDADAGRWAEVNRPYELHHIKIRDAYWRRRMLAAKLNGEDVKITAQVY